MPTGLAVLAMLSLALIVSPAAPAQEARPKKKDAPAKLQPKGVTFATAVKPAEAKAGETVRLEVTAKLDRDYHIYSLTSPEGGPNATEFDLYDTAGLKVAGRWTPDREPERKKDPLFPIPFVESYETQVTWSIPLTIPGGTEPGEKVLKVQAGYQICDQSSCSIPGRWTIAPVKLKVVPGGAAAGQTDDEVVATGGPGPDPSPSLAEGGPLGRGPATTPEGAGSVVATSGASPVVVGDVEKSLQQGLFPFLMLSIGAGLLALVMPCVWPMVPITVNFFVKQGQARQGGSTLGLAITYCVSIIAVYTLVGVLFSAFLGAASLQELANATWLNLLVAALFIAFGLSLLGLFEIRLPSSMLNATSRGESRGGLVGVVFMALTLTITSFTCTFPVVGGLLVMAAGGSYLYPVIGLATFATVLALPFFLLALAPGLLRQVPRSGDWMNAVKVVGGLLEIGAAFKFLNTAEVSWYGTPEDAWFDAQVVLSVWVVLALVCGIYLLGLFRTDHDHDAVKVGPARMLVGTMFLFLALFLSPSLFGVPPQSKVFNRVVVGILPPDYPELIAARGASGPVEGKGVRATSSDPNVAASQETKFHGVAWGLSYDDAMERARATGKPVLIDFTGVNCANCRLMESYVLPREDVVALLERFVTVELFTDRVPIGSITPDERKEMAQQNALRLVEMTGENTNPFYVALSPEGTILAQTGFCEPPAFIDFLNRALEARAEAGEKLATAD